MGALVAPWLDGDAWNRFVVGGVTFTGEVEISGDAIKKKLDRRRRSGSDGGTSVDRGRDMRHATVKLTAFDDEHLLQLERIRLVADPAATQRRNALAVTHPALAFAGIGQVYVESMSLPKPSNKLGVEVEIKLREHREPTNRNRTRRPAAAPADDVDPALAGAEETGGGREIPLTGGGREIPAPSTTAATSPNG